MGLSNLSRPWQIAVNLAVFTVTFSTIMLLCLLEDGFFVIPYLTPLAHYVTAAVKPFFPLIAPVTLGAFLKICVHETWPQKKLWMVITGSYSANHFISFVGTHVMSLYKGRSKCGGLKFCGLQECLGAWVEETLLVVVVVSTIVGFKWDFGLVDRWVETIIKQDVERRKALQLKKDEESMADAEKGMSKEAVEGDMETNIVGLVDEKEPLIEA